MAYALGYMIAVLTLSALLVLGAYALRYVADKLRGGKK
ncbi:hypothetical protein EC99P2_00024 [Enterococcus phage EC99P2]|nr:hypothetical protein EC99P2_00024 [Enterococcus phage EC99P2]